MKVIQYKEVALLEVLQDIVMETMDYPLMRRVSSDSYLPEELIAKAQKALALYGLELPEHKAKVAA